MALQLANVALSDTFDTWRVRTNQIIAEAGSLTSTSPQTFTANTTFSSEVSVDGVLSAATISANSFTTGAFSGPVTAPIVTANSFVGPLTGTASIATTISLVATNTTDATHYPLFADAATGDENPRTDTGFTYNPNSGTLTSTTFSGALAGNASTATALQTARTIGGVSFDGTANIDLPGVNTTGNQDTTGTATLATNVTVTDNNNNETVYVVFVDGATGSQGIESDTALAYNPSTGILAATDFNSTSDISLKENITTIENATDKVSKLRGINFNWKENNRYAMGVVAQEVENIVPEVVNEIDGIKKVSYGSLVGLLIEAVKDLQEQVNELKS